MSFIHLSPAHGLNPSVNVCFYCNGEKNEVVLAGRLPHDAEAPRKAAWNLEPCDKCKGFMEQGIILISVDEKKSGDDTKNPYRTGGWIVVTEEAVRRMGLKPPEFLEDICKRRVAFMPDEVWDHFGLPRAWRDKAKELDVDEAQMAVFEKMSAEEATLAVRKLEQAKKRRRP